MPSRVRATDRVRLLALLRLGGGSTAVVIGLIVVTALIPSATALATGWLADRLEDVVRGRGDGYVIPLVVLAVLLVGEQVARTARLAGGATVAQRIDAAVRSRVRACYQRAPLALAEDTSFADDASRAGELASVNGFVRSPGRAAEAQVNLVLRYVSALLAAAIVARYSVWLAIALLVVAAGTRELQRRRWKIQMDRRDVLDVHRHRAGHWTDLALDATAGKEVRLFGLSSWIADRRRAESWEWLGDLTQVRRWVLNLEWWLLAPRLLAAGAALYFPGMSALDGRLAAGDLVQTLVAATAVLAVSHLGSESFMVDYGLQALNALERIERRAPAAAEPSPPEPDGAPVRIEVDGLCFRYPGAPRPVIDGLTLTVEPREVLAVVGRNGIGKTTLIKLIAGLYEPNGGEIRVDGAPLSPATATTWQRRVAVVFQNFNRYPLSAADNIALGAPEARADQEGIRRAAERAGLAGLIESLPQSYDTLLTRELRGGTDLSGGQWQKLAIARALFAVDHGRRLLVFDEPTAHLDVAAEASFHERVVAQVARRASVVLISHRLSTVRAADQIVLLDESGIAEQGTHTELMAHEGQYARMFALQVARFTEARAETVTAASAVQAEGGPA
ncbi:ABC transporter ATP-binding protein [Nonomuraea africana]|uniref:ABC transporter ATP-binding protein n=1 Tax=Nonomuraea africana TaxID=46171 RepID=UPI0033C8F226